MFWSRVMQMQRPDFMQRNKPCDWRSPHLCSLLFCRQGNARIRLEIPAVNINIAMVVTSILVSGYLSWKLYFQYFSLWFRWFLKKKIFSMHISLLLWCHMTHGHQKTHVDMSWDQFCSVGLIFQSCDIVDDTLVVLLHQRLSCREPRCFGRAYGCKTTPSSCEMTMQGHLKIRWRSG